MQEVTIYTCSQCGRMHPLFFGDTFFLCACGTVHTNIAVGTTTVAARVYPKSHPIHQLRVNTDHFSDDKRVIGGVDERQ